MEHYCLNCGKELSEEQLICPKCNHCSWFDSLAEADDKVAGVLVAAQLQANTQWEKYRCGRDGSTGHGFAAEDANALNDMFNGCVVDLTGRDNSKAGADRISNGEAIQTKYYQTAEASVNAAFDTEGLFIYKGQILEVPKDQYEQALDLVRKKITDGKVAGITNPEDASKIVKRGSVTYRQAKNIAKAGNVDSLIFDIKTQSVSALSSLGISFTINAGLMLLFSQEKKLSVDEVFQLAFLSGLQNGTITMASGILTTQIIKTQFGRNLAACVQSGTKNGVDFIYQCKIGKEIVHRLSKSLFSKGVYGIASKNAVTKFLRTNTITNLAVFVVSSGPDTWYLINNKMSAPQFIQNLIVRGSSLAGGMLGTVLGAYLGPVGMLGGALAGGTFFDWGAKKIASTIRKDDSEKMYMLIKVALTQLSNDYMIQTPEEFSRCMTAIKDAGALDENLIRIMYSIGQDTNNDFLRVQVAYERLEYYFGAVVRQRKVIKLLNNQGRIIKAIDKLGEEIPQKFTLNNNYIT